MEDRGVSPGIGDDMMEQDSRPQITQMGDQQDDASRDMFEPIYYAEGQDEGNGRTEWHSNRPTPIGHQTKEEDLRGQSFSFLERELICLYTDYDLSLGIMDDIIQIIQHRQTTLSELRWPNGRQMNDNLQKHADNVGLNAPKTERISIGDTSIVLTSHNAADVIKKEFGKPQYAPHMLYEPRKVTTKGGERTYSEFQDGDLFWELQGSVPRGGLVLGIFIASDGTTTDGLMRKVPVYLALANLPKHLRRHCLVLLAIVPELPENLTPSERQSLYHKCWSVLLAPLVDAAMNGIEIVGPDGRIWLAFPRIVGLGKAYPEGILLGGLQQGQSCFNCLVKAVDFSDLVIMLRNNQFGPLKRKALVPRKALEMREGRELIESRGITAAEEFAEQHGIQLEDIALDAVLFCDAYPLLRGDILHDIWSGVLKRCIEIIVRVIKEAAFEDNNSGKRQANNVIRGLNRLFTKGYFDVLKSATATEYRNIAMTSPCVLASWGCVGENIREIDLQAFVVPCLRHLTDFGVIMSLDCIPSDMLDEADEHLRQFVIHSKQIDGLFLERVWAVPKVHELLHYREHVLDGGSPDNWNSDAYEMGHQKHVKARYRTSNRRPDTVDVQILNRDRIHDAFTELPTPNEDGVLLDSVDKDENESGFVLFRAGAYHLGGRKTGGAVTLLDFVESDDCLSGAGVNWDEILRTKYHQIEYGKRWWPHRRGRVPHLNELESSFVTPYTRIFVSQRPRHQFARPSTMSIRAVPNWYGSEWRLAVAVSTDLGPQHPYFAVALRFFTNKFHGKNYGWAAIRWLKFREIDARVTGCWKVAADAYDIIPIETIIGPVGLCPDAKEQEAEDLSNGFYKLYYLTKPNRDVWMWFRWLEGTRR
ncbi:hypothetical protein HDU93_003173 [Gonapodya sp. JEL0774]|nr:hypothetical protein HDU93_003173 [Gonapodya sp. JEL0774]